MKRKYFLLASNKFAIVDNKETCKLAIDSHILDCPHHNETSHLSKKFLQEQPPEVFHKKRCSKIHIDGVSF